MNFPSIGSKGEHLILFLENLRKSFSPKLEENAKPERSFKDSLTSFESYFIYNLHFNSIEDHVGFDRLLGCESQEVSLEKILSVIHAQDRKEIGLIIQETVLQLINLEIPIGTNYLNLSFRMKTETGEYVHVISNNIVHSVDSEERPSSILVKYNQVSFLDNSEVVNWWADSSYIDCGSIEDRLTEGKEDLFTNRQKEIVELIIKGHTSSQIARELNISVHTVVTHRKNIFRKSDCHSIEDLENYCAVNRLI